MPSPFPGMDPHLEARWRDVHARLILYSSDAIQEQLPSDLRAWVEERVVLETPSGISSGLFPDAITEGYIQVIDTSSGNQVVTIIEVLSPTNKLSGQGRQDYLRKQANLRHSTTNLVEIDLLRQGEHVVAVPLAHIPAEERSPYLVCVRRAATPGKAELYPVSLQQPLPAIRIPLRPSDEDVHLDLQAILTQVYQRGRYDGVFDYSRNPQPPFTGAEATWVDQLLKDKGLRPTATRRRKPRGGKAQ